MEKEEINPPLKILLLVYYTAVKTTAAVILLFAFIMLLAQTSFCPLNLKLLADYGYENTLAALRPYKTAFPQPLEIKLIPE